MTTNPEFAVDIEKAIGMLWHGDLIHTFRNSGGLLLGADWPREKLIEHMRNHGVEEAGDMASSMGHKLVLLDDVGYLWIATVKS